MGVEIHNGQIIVDGQPVPETPSPGLTPLVPPSPSQGVVEDIEPEEIARQMAQAIAGGIEVKLLPMEIVNSLLTLRSARGHKLVWTRFDVHQTFALWARKMEGRSRV